MALIQNEDNKCPTTKQVNDALKSMGGGIADAIDLLNGSLDGSTIILFNNTTTDTSVLIEVTSMTSTTTSSTVDIPASSMVVYPIPIAGVIRNSVIQGDCVLGSNAYVAAVINNVKNINVYSSIEDSRLFIGTNQNIPLQGLLAVMCINNT